MKLTPYDQSELDRLDKEIAQHEASIRRKQEQRREIINRSNANKRVPA
ncbi:hypothetical protein [Dryocola sp. BD626]